jgi:hypothetical protein
MTTLEKARGSGSGRCSGTDRSSKRGDNFPAPGPGFAQKPFLGATGGAAGSAVAQAMPRPTRFIAKGGCGAKPCNETVSSNATPW